MKTFKILIAFLLLFVCGAYGQVYIGSLDQSNIYTTATGTTTLWRRTGLEPFGTVSNLKVIFKYDTAILFKGVDTVHEHVWATQRKSFSNQGCAVNHGPEGCPDDWYDNKTICTICLRHMHIKETRTTEPIKDLYMEAVERLAKLKK